MQINKTVNVKDVRFSVWNRVTGVKIVTVPPSSGLSRPASILINVVLPVPGDATYSRLT